MVATKRLGSARELKQEFSKENLATLWSARLMWILVGMVFVKLGIGFYLFASRGAGETVLALTNSARFAGLTIMATKAFLIGIVVYEAWYFLTEKDQRRLRAMDSAFNWAFTHPVQTLAALFTIAILPASVGLLHLLDANAIVHHLLIGNLQPFKVHFSQFVFPMVVMPLAKLSLVLGLAYWIYHRQSGNSITA